MFIVFVRFEGTTSTHNAAFRTQTEHKLSNKTKTTKFAPYINPLASQSASHQNAKMAQSKKHSHQLCASVPSNKRFALAGIR
jgi:hypothetical protein